MPVVGGAADLVLDEARNRLYLVNSNRNQVEVYSIPQRRFLNPIPVDEQPLAAEMSRSGNFLYVASHLGSALLTIDLETLAVVNRVSLPARPEGVAVGYDERVLISTVGTGQNNLLNVLLIYDPSQGSSTQSLSAVTVPPPPPASPLLPQQNFGRPALGNRSVLQATPDGRLIFGVNIPNNTQRAVFVYEVASGTVLRSRTVAGVSPVLSVSPDGSKFMAGLHLFEMDTLNVLAQQNAANAPYSFPANSNFNLQQNQGGSVWSPDGFKIYTAFNFTPVQNPPARPSVSQLMVNDPENLLIEAAYQLPENLSGRIVISGDGANAYALSDSGFLSLPFSTIGTSPVAMISRTSALLANDQCGVTNDLRAAQLELVNAGRGRITANLQLMMPATTVGLGGAGGPGGGQAGGGIIIVIPPVPGAPGGGQVPGGGQIPGGGQLAPPTGATGNVNVNNSAPVSRTILTAQGATFEFFYNRNNRAIGTVSPVHQYTVTSNEAINIPPALTVYQNNRNAEATGDIMPVDVGLSQNEGLTDLVLDSLRQRLYIANSGMNRVEVFDTRTRKFGTPIKVGQLPRSMAMSPDGQTLYVANTGGESISIVDLQSREVVGRVRFPALPFNNNAAIIRPLEITSTQRGPLVLMSNNTLWRVIGNEATPRRFNANVLPIANNTQTLPAPTTMASSPNGEFALVLAGNGSAYLYDAAVDDFIQARQVVTAPISGYYGPIAVGPRGQYFLVNGLVLNQALTQVGNAGTVPGTGAVRPGQPPVTTPRPISSVSAVGATTFVRFAQPAIANAAAAAALTEAASVELVNATTGATMRTVPSLERPLSTPTGNQRANVPGRTMAVDPTGSIAYAITASGLSIVNLDAPPPIARPVINPNGTVNIASYQPQMAQGSLVSIFGRAMGGSSVAASTPLPTVMGGTCVTLDNNPLPLLMTSAEQINAQIPPNVAPGRYPLIIRNLEQNTASVASQITVAKYAPAVFVDPSTNQVALFHSDGRLVTRDNPARRDQRLTLYATGLGPTKGGVVIGGLPSPSDPLAVTDKLEVFFGDPTFNGSEMIVEWSGLTPGYVGLYQINLYVPGIRMRGNDLPVTIRIGNINSPTKGPLVPVVTVD
ncbi:MAG: hypothetical protein JJE04_06445 [Acidobacteriia bacterium]|nr:hypothetical protein [Terriglobia bacterium]